MTAKRVEPLSLGLARVADLIPQALWDEALALLDWLLAEEPGQQTP
jgi:hypothetical protein